MKFLVCALFSAMAFQVHADTIRPKDMSATLTCSNGVTCEDTFAGGGISCSNGVSCTNSMGALNCSNGASCTYVFGNLSCSTDASPCDQ